jgi:hypothetical protein
MYWSETHALQSATFRHADAFTHSPDQQAPAVAGTSPTGQEGGGEAQVTIAGSHSGSPLSLAVTSREPPSLSLASDDGAIASPLQAANNTANAWIPTALAMQMSIAFIRQEAGRRSVVSDRKKLIWRCVSSPALRRCDGLS